MKKLKLLLHRIAWFHMERGEGEAAPSELFITMQWRPNNSQWCNEPIKTTWRASYVRKDISTWTLFIRRRHNRCFSSSSVSLGTLGFLAPTGTLIAMSRHCLSSKQHNFFEIFSCIAQIVLQRLHWKNCLQTQQSCY